MALVLPVLEKHPQWGTGCFFAENATLIGDIILGDHCSVWFNTVIRGDVNLIRIGNNSNIQDGTIIHCTYQKASTLIGNHVSIGHRALIHGCQLEDNVLIGMGAIVMDHVLVQEYCIIAAGAVVLENTICESGYLYAGTPAKKIKGVTHTQRKLIKQLAHNYVLYSTWY